MTRPSLALGILHIVILSPGRGDARSVSPCGLTGRIPFGFAPFLVMELADI